MSKAAERAPKAPTESELREEHFAEMYVETCNASQSYRDAYDYTGKHAGQCARMVLKRPRVEALVAELRAWHREQHGVTVGSLIQEFEDARKLALDTEQASSMVSATMGKAKLLGLDKQVVEHTGKNGDPLSISVNFVGKKRDEDMC